MLSAITWTVDNDSIRVQKMIHIIWLIFLETAICIYGYAMAITKRIMILKFEIVCPKHSNMC